MRRSRPLLAVLLGALFTFGPLLSVLLASAVANANGCALDEGSVHPCPLGGWDAGGVLYSLGVMGWFMLVTLPVGAVLGGAGLIRGVARWLRRQTSPPGR